MELSLKTVSENHKFRAFYKIFIEGGTSVKRKIISKFCLAFLLSLSLILSVFSSVQAAEFPSSWPQAPEIAEETGILIAVNEILEEKRVRHIESYLREHPEALQLTSGANPVVSKDTEKA